MFNPCIIQRAYDHDDVYYNNIYLYMRVLCELRVCVSCYFAAGLLPRSHSSVVVMRILFTVMQYRSVHCIG